MKNWTNWTFTKTSKSTGNVVRMQEFQKEKDALQYFHNEAKELGYKVTERDNGFLVADGKDYEIELQWDNFG
jgi:hypothetical protein